MIGRLVKFGFLGAICAISFKIFNDLGINISVANHQPGKCHVLPGISGGSEDIKLLTNGVAVIASGLKLPFASSCPHGNLYLVDLAEDNSEQEDDATPHARKVDIIGHPDIETFYPLGISILETKSKVALYVVNGFKHVVEVYDLNVETATAKYKKSIRDPAFRSMNSLVVTAPDTFYVTNAGHFTDLMMESVEIILGLPLGDVVHYDGKAGKVVLSGLKMPNGITLASESQTLVLSLTGSKELRSYRVHKNASLEPISSIDLGTAPDNLFLDEESYLWTGAHPIGWQLWTHLYDPSKYAAPSQVIKLKYDQDTGDFEPVTEVYVDDGSTLQGASGVVRKGHRLLIGTMLDKLMLCKLLS